MPSQKSRFPAPADGSARKLCFVTVGATAPFNALIRAVLQKAFLKALSKNGYTDLLIQYGRGGQEELESAEAVQVDHELLRHAEGIRIAGFDFREDGLSYEMRAASGRGFAGFELQGLVISHAGSGSILEGLRLGVPMVVVPNSQLLDNHQEDLAGELASQGYVVHGDITSPDFADVVRKAEELRRKTKSWPPVNSGVAAPAGVAGIVNEELGFQSLD